MNTLQAYLERFGGNFLVAAFVPSLAFVTASVLALGPVTPIAVLTRIEFLLGPLGKNNVAWAILMIAVIVGFTLSSLNTYIYKLFEGYVFTKQLSYFRSIELERAHQFRDAREEVVKKIRLLEKRLDAWNKNKMPQRSRRQENRIRTEIQNLKAKRDTISAEYDQRYPPLEEFILPTRFGNILRASETYPRIRWGIDAVTMWPRLIYAASNAPKGDEYLTKVDISNDQCSFLLNSSLLSGLFAILVFLISLYQLIMLYLKSRGVKALLYFLPVDSSINIYQQRILVYILIAFIGLAVFWFFYTASLYSVSQYGSYIRSTYDLFHLNLLKALRLDDLPPDALPADTNHEKMIWKRVCEFIAMGEVNGPFNFEYEEPKSQKTV